jgi:hypothetical protein
VPRRCLPYLLVLLLSSADLDDVWAYATPDPADDAQAAENNEYLQVTRGLGGRFGITDLTSAGQPAALPADVRPCLPPPRPLPALTTRLARRASLLYVFMSLQR